MVRHIVGALSGVGRKRLRHKISDAMFFLVFKGRIIHATDITPAFIFVFVCNFHINVLFLPSAVNPNDHFHGPIYRLQPAPHTTRGSSPAPPPQVKISAFITTQSVLFINMQSNGVVDLTEGCLSPR